MLICLVAFVAQSVSSFVSFGAGQALGPALSGTPLTLVVAPSVGQCLVVIIVVDIAAVSSVSDNNGNVYALVQEQAIPTSAMVMSVWVTVNLVRTGPSFTVTAASVSAGATFSSFLTLSYDNVASIGIPAFVTGASIIVTNLIVTPQCPGGAAALALLSSVVNGPSFSGATFVRSGSLNLAAGEQDNLVEQIPVTLSGTSGGGSPWAFAAFVLEASLCGAATPCLGLQVSSCLCAPTFCTAVGSAFVFGQLFVNSTIGLVVVGNLTLSAGAATVVAIDGVPTTALITATGDAQVHGTMTVSLSNSPDGAVIPILTAVSLRGQFSNISMVSIDPCSSYSTSDVLYSSSTVSIVIHVVPMCSGDTLSTGAIVGIAVGAGVVAIVTVLLIVFVMRRSIARRDALANRNLKNKELDDLNQQALK